jgi:hypothetical protein
VTVWALALGAALSVPLLWVIERSSKRETARLALRNADLDELDNRGFELARWNGKRPPVLHPRYRRG